VYIDIHVSDRSNHWAGFPFCSRGQDDSVDDYDGRLRGLTSPGSLFICVNLKVMARILNLFVFDKVHKTTNDIKI
jgi:hypothetical protein